MQAACCAEYGARPLTGSSAPHPATSRLDRHANAAGALIAFQAVLGRAALEDTGGAAGLRLRCRALAGPALAAQVALARAAAMRGRYADAPAARLRLGGADAFTARAGFRGAACGSAVATVLLVVLGVDAGPVAVRQGAGARAACAACAACAAGAGSACAVYSRIPGSTKTRCGFPARPAGMPTE